MTTDDRWAQLGNAYNLINLDGIEFRDYQLNIIRSIGSNGNTLVVLPTGLGKTFIATAVMASALASGKRAMLLAPTKPLSEQHYSVLTKLLKIPQDEILLLTGSIGKKNRGSLEGKARVIIATPQTVANDLKNSMMLLDGFGAVVFDECHRAVGKYAYTYIANECGIREILVVGLTASPGAKKEKINALVDALGIRHIDARLSTDHDVMQYVMPKYVHIVNVNLSDRIKEIAAALKPEIESNVHTLNGMGLLRFRNFEFIPKGRLIDLGNQIGKIHAANYRMGAMYAYSKLLNLVHSYDLILCEGIYPFSSYVESLYSRDKKSRSLESLLKSRAMLLARNSASIALKNGEEHPKVLAVLDVLSGYKGKKVMIFAQYRSTVKMLVELISNNGIKAMPFVGKREGVTQEQQKKTLSDFRNGEFDVLVASSIGEEGIDIPGVDVVIFYEPIPNEVRNIQRRGRTGRFDSGDIYILVASGTKDQIYLRISEQRETKMMNLIHSVNEKLQRHFSVLGQSRLK
ncbi:DEAD/DEAH box helicase family protein [Candidatus Marsarchaeota archaeon]|nr:DEAD/DEAH box helicase family protein [Candidatus Marsarchaeota archaeon]